VGRKHKIGVEAKIACHARPAHQGCPAQGVAGGVHVADYDACQPVRKSSVRLVSNRSHDPSVGLSWPAGVQQVATDAEPGLCEPVPTSPVGALKVALKVAAPYPVVDEQAGGAVVDDASGRLARRSNTTTPKSFGSAVIVRVKPRSSKTKVTFGAKDRSDTSLSSPCLSRLPPSTRIPAFSRSVTFMISHPLAG